MKIASMRNPSAPLKKQTLNPKLRLSSALTVLGVLLALGAGPARAGIVVTSDHIVSGSAVGTLAVIDQPYQATPASGPIGPSWPETAGCGWRALANCGFDAIHGAAPWKPDGTPWSAASPYGQAQCYRYYGGGAETWTFNLSDGLIDLPDV